MRTAISFLSAMLLAGTAAAQDARYRASPDTLRYESANTYRMFFVRGGDTLGDPIATTTRELRYFRPAGDGLELWVRLQGVGPDAFSDEETYAITPEGRVLAVNGQPVAGLANARIDVLPRFAAAGRALRAGAEWTDTVSLRGMQPYGASHYEVRRSYRVVRVVDTVGTRLALLVAGGEMRLRQGGWQDSTQGLVWWQDVAGPVVDTVWFDARRGQIHAAVVVMDLAGTGGFGPPGGGVTLPSGLRSSVRLTRVP